MNNPITEELEIIQSSKTCLNRFLMREEIINHLREKGDLTDAELAFVAREYPQLILDNMNPDARVVLAYVKEGNTLSAHTFPEKVWEDKEVVYQAFCHKRHLPSAANKRVDEAIYKRFVEEHSTLEIASFFSDRHYLLEGIDKIIKDKEIIHRINKATELKLNIDYEWETEEISLDHKHLNIDVFSELDLSGDIELVKKTPAPKYTDIDMGMYEDSVYPRLFHYISDLHLTHTIKAQIEKGTPLEKAVKIVVRKAARDIEKSISCYKERLTNSWEPQILMICGDVSFDYNIAKEFYEEISNSLSIKPEYIYIVLGNHELWDSDPRGLSDHDYDDVIEKYRSLLATYGITLLENQVAVVVSDGPFGGEEQYVLDADFLFNDSNQNAIELLFSKSRYIICGGIGFSGYNENFNVENGIYRKTIKTRDEEIRRSQLFDELLWRVKSLAKGKTILSLTHMPKEDWSHKLEWDDCIFINGHTHKNYRSEDNTKVFADNQIGYKSNRYTTKQFIVDASYDIFDSYPDGIHKISRVDYSEFGRGIGLHLSFRYDQQSQIYLLKRDGIYMFVSENDYGLSVLNGGRKKKLRSIDLKYYYSNMSRYAEIMKSAFQGYEKYLESISKEIRQLGGSGRIHGCIVDVDNFNHIYVNPYDGKITCYFAKDIMSRKVFSGFVEMIEGNESRSEILNNIKKNLFQRTIGRELMTLNNPMIPSGNTIIDTGTYLYKPSGQINKIHKLFNYRVLQLWED